MPGPWEKYQQAAEQTEPGPWQKYGSGVPSAPSRVGEDVSEMGSALADYAKKSALPTAGSLALPAALSMGLGPANAPFVALEQGIGSGLGEAANQVLGITEPSLKQIGLATAAPIVAGYATNLLRTVKTLPGTLNTQGPIMAKTQIQGYRGPVPAKDVMDAATQQGLSIPLTKTTQALQDMRNLMFDKTPAGQRAFEKVLKDTGLEELATAPNGVTPSKMQALLFDIGKLQSDAATSESSGISKEYLGRFFKSLNDDLDNAGAALGPARAYWKREQVLNDLEGAINSAVFTPKGQGLQTQFNANKIINELNDTTEGLGKWFSQSFSRSEQAEIKNLFGFLNTLPSLQPSAGQHFGSGRFWQRIERAGAGSGIGGGAGYLMGGPAGAAIGAGAGLLVPEAINTGRLMLQAWKMPGGKTVVKTLLNNSDGAITPRVVESLTSFVMAGAAQNVKPTQSGTLLQPMPNEP